MSITPVQTELSRAEKISRYVALSALETFIVNLELPPIGGRSAPFREGHLVAGVDAHDLALEGTNELECELWPEDDSVEQALAGVSVDARLAEIYLRVAQPQQFFLEQARYFTMLAQSHLADLLDPGIDGEAP